MANLTKELCVAAENKPGTLARVAACLKEAGVSIQGVGAWGDGGKSSFCILTENNQKAGEALKKGGFNWQEKEVVSCQLPHRVGSLAECLKKVADAGVNIDHCYVTATGSNALLVFATDNNQKALSCCP